MLDVFSELNAQLVCASLLTNKHKTYNHTFGGGGYAGATHPECEHAWHLLYRLDLTDPAIGISLPQSRYLPLFSAIQYDSSSIQYRPTSDSEVTVISQDNLNHTPDWPRPDFPSVLPEHTASLSSDSPEDVVYDEDMQEFWWDFDTDTPQEPPPNRNEMCALTAGVNQLQVVNHTKCNSCGQLMDFIAAATGDPEEDIVEIWGDSYVAMLFMFCKQCHVIDSSILAN